MKESEMKTKNKSSLKSNTEPLFEMIGWQTSLVCNDPKCIILRLNKC